jgi:YbgC/YbaW family acyl-CoA thioester hydrolase
MTRLSRHTLRRRVNFYEVDQAAIVHFSTYYRYMEEAEHAFWRAAGVKLADARGLGFPRVAAAFEFHAPLRFDDEFDAELQIAAIGRSSLRYACRITREGLPIATGSMTIVCVDVGPPMRAVPLPREIAERIEVAVEPSPPASRPAVEYPKNE